MQLQEDRERQNARAGESILCLCGAHKAEGFLSVNARKIVFSL
jgi:hypothetical protein